MENSEKTQKKKILIVEDEVSLLKVLEKTFTKEGYEIVSATDGKKGLETALKTKPDLILLDIVLPVIDGVTMLNQLRTDSWGATVPIIILTNLNYFKGLEPYVHFPSLQPTADGGVSDFLVKSDWELKDIVTKVKEKLGNQ